MEAVTRPVEHLGQSQDEVLPTSPRGLALAGRIPALGQASDSPRMILNLECHTGIQNVLSVWRLVLFLRNRER